MPTLDPLSLPPVTARPRQRNLLPLIIGGLLVGTLLIVTGSTALLFNLLNQRASNLPALLPAETQVYATFTPNLSDLPNIERLQRTFPETFDYQNNETTANLLAEQFGVTFNDDIAPWIGAEMSFAVYGLPVERIFNARQLTNVNPLFGPSLPVVPLDSTAINEGNTLFLISARDQRAAQNFLDKQRTYRESKGEQFTSSTTDGITVYASENSNTPFAAFAFVRDTVVFANNPRSIVTLIQQASDSSLARNTAFQTTLQNLPNDRIGTIYIAGTVIEELIKASTNTANLNETTPFVRDALAAGQATHGLGLTIAVVEQGLRFDATAAFDQSRLDNALRERLATIRPSVSSNRTDDVSSEAVGVISFAIPADWGQQLREQLAASPDTARVLLDLERGLNIDLERDLFSWLHGEGVIAIFPDNGELPVGGYFALRVADQTAAQRGMQTLATVIEDVIGVSFETVSLGRTQVQAITQGGLFVGYGFNGSDLVVAVGRQAMESAYVAETKLTNVATYTDALKSMPSPNAGIIYVDLAAVRELNKRLSNSSNPELDRWFEAFRAITTAGTTGVNDLGIARGTLLLSIEP